MAAFKNTITAAALAASTSTAHAGAGFDITGNDIYPICTNPATEMACTMFVAGVIKGYLSAAAIETLSLIHISEPTRQ